jgi:hypothetical protein
MTAVVKAQCELLKHLVDERLKTTDPSKVVALTAGVTFALAYLYGQLTDKVL